MKTTNDAIRALQEMRAELQQRIDAIDLSINLLKGTNHTSPILDVPCDYEEPTIEERPTTAGKTRNTKFESSVDFASLQQPLGPWNCHKCDTYNPSTASVCVKCKAPRPQVAD